MHFLYYSQPTFSHTWCELLFVDVSGGGGNNHTFDVYRKMYAPP